MTAATNTSEAENAVRKYLLFLEDPNRLRDDKDIQQKTQAVLDASDPLDKLRALAVLERAANIDEEPLRKGFTAHARAWAEEHSIPVAAFKDLKVSDDVLREAGFEIASKGRGRNVSAGERQRAKAVPVEDIKAYVLQIDGTFILTDIIGGVGGSQATVRKAVDELIEAGTVKKLGPLPDYTGRGRAPLHYSLS